MQRRRWDCGRGSGAREPRPVEGDTVRPLRYLFRVFPRLFRAAPRAVNLPQASLLLVSDYHFCRFLGRCATLLVVPTSLLFPAYVLSLMSWA